MHLRTWLPLVVVCPLVLAAAAPPTAAEDLYPPHAAQAFLETLDAPRRAAVQQPFDSAARLQWEFRPGRRVGLPIGALEPRQRAALETLWHQCLGAEGLRRIGGVLLRERILHGRLDEATRRRDPSWRHPGGYYIAVFGAPAGDTPWSWRLEGHHLSIHLTYVGDRLLSATPTFLGGSPAEVRDDGGHVAVATLDAWRRLWASLGPEQRARAFGGARLPGDLEMQPRGARLPARGPGLPAQDLTPVQGDLLVAVLATYPVGTRARDVHVPRTLEDLADVRVWIRGDPEARRPHHLAIAGPRFAAEHCDVGQHLHLLWRTDHDHGATP